MDEGTIDRRIEMNTRRIEMMQRHIDRFTERKQRFVDDNISLQAQKAQIIKDKEKIKT